MAKQVVPAYSGGLHPSVASRWPQEVRGFDVVALTIDLGNEKDLQTVEQRAYEIGAVKAIVRDGKRPFIDYFAFPALMAGAVYEGTYLLATAIGRPMLRRRPAPVTMATFPVRRENGASSGISSPSIPAWQQLFAGSIHRPRRTPQRSRATVRSRRDRVLWVQRGRRRSRAAP